MSGIQRPSVHPGRRVSKSWIGLCRASHLRLPHEPTIREILSNPIVKAVVAADAVDAKVLRAQLRNVARKLTNSA